MPKSIPDQDTPQAGFLQRWSERKANARDIDDAPSSSPATMEDDAAATESAAPQEPGQHAAPPVTEADLENLTYESDFTRFMGDHVPEALRRRALRALWRSDPVLANIDGLCDYDDDFTDAALAVKTLQTAHRIGQGYLDDDELAANRARGEPADTTAARDHSDDDEFDDSEYIEDPDAVGSTESEPDQQATASSAALDPAPTGSEIASAADDDTTNSA